MNELNTNNNWFPIETAPKDGTKILVYYFTKQGMGCFGGPEIDTHTIVVAEWYSKLEMRLEDAPELGDGIIKRVPCGKTEGWMIGWFSIRPSLVKPTHWMPLPTPPNF